MAQVTIGLDVQLIAQTVLYFASGQAGFATVIPIGLAMAKSDAYGGCHFLYDVNNYGGKSKCNFIICACVFGGTVYGFVLGAYNTFVICKGRKDPTSVSRMWVMPFMLTNGISAIILFISSCMVSVGFYQFCSSIIAKVESPHVHLSCAVTERVLWGNNYLTVAQIASWACFLVALLQAALCTFRLYRNRRRRSNLQIQSDGSGDTHEISQVEPTA